MSFVIAVVSALVGAAGAGLITWLQSLRARARTAEIGRRYLLENLSESETALTRAIATDVNWWWPAGTPVPTSAWDEYQIVLREDLDGEAVKEVVDAIRRLKELNAWAVSQAEHEDRLLGAVSAELQRPEADMTEAGREERQALGPKWQLGDRERQTIRTVIALIVKLKDEILPNAASEIALRRRRDMARFGIPTVLAVIAVAAVLVATRPVFTSDSLASAVALDFPGSSVSCDLVPGRQSEWDCSVATENSQTAATGPRYTADARFSPQFATSTKPISRLAEISEYYVRKQAKTDNYYGWEVGQDPPAGGNNPAKPSQALPSYDGLPPIPGGARPDETIAGTVR